MNKGEKLYEELGEVDEKYVHEAENYTRKNIKKKTGNYETEKIESIVKISERRRRIFPAVAAACFAVAAVSLPVILSRNSSRIPSSDIPEITDTGIVTEDVPEVTDADTVTEEENQVTESELSKELPSCIYEINKQTNEYELVFRTGSPYEVPDDGFENPEINSWSVDTAISEISDYLMEKYNLESHFEGQIMFLNGGYELYLTTDRDVQEYLDDSYEDWYYFPEALSDTSPEVYSDVNALKIQSAFVVMDYKGHILGVEGKIGEKEHNMEWNSAIDTHRLPGSAITPVTAYGYALENNLMSYSSFHYDEFLPDGVYGEESWPLNYDGTPSKGYYPAWYFLKNSINTLPAQLVYNNGNSLVNEVFDFATQKLHLDLEPEYDINYDALCMGSTNTGPNVVNLANAYMPYGNGGKYYKATIISKCVDSSGEVIIDNENREGEQAVSEETAYIMNKMLTDVIETGTGTAAKLDNTVVAGKTGTSEEWRDLNFVGMTPDYLTAMWVGYHVGSNVWAIERANSARIWKDVFGTYADEHAAGTSFPECETVSCEKYCAVTGKKAVSGCTEGGTGYFKSGDEYCDGKH